MKVVLHEFFSLASGQVVGEFVVLVALAVGGRPFCKIYVAFSAGVWPICRMYVFKMALGHFVRFNAFF